jgi:hypothetical protein
MSPGGIVAMRNCASEAVGRGNAVWPVGAIAEQNRADANSGL